MDKELEELLKDPEFVESLEQMKRGEGRVIDLGEFRSEEFEQYKANLTNAVDLRLRAKASNEAEPILWTTDEIASEWVLVPRKHLRAATVWGPDLDDDELLMVLAAIVADARRLGVDSSSGLITRAMAQFRVELSTTPARVGGCNKIRLDHASPPHGPSCTADAGHDGECQYPYPRDHAHDRGRCVSGYDYENEGLGGT